MHISDVLSLASLLFGFLLMWLAARAYQRSYVLSRAAQIEVALAHELVRSFLYGSNIMGVGLGVSMRDETGVLVVYAEDDHTLVAEHQGRTVLIRAEKEEK